MCSLQVLSSVFVIPQNWCEDEHSKTVASITSLCISADVIPGGRGGGYLCSLKTIHLSLSFPEIGVKMITVRL